MTKQNKKGNGWVVALVILFMIVAAVIGGVLYASSSKNWYDEKYMDDWTVFTGMCVEAGSEYFHSTTLIYCDCAYQQYRELYGEKSIGQNYELVTKTIGNDAAMKKAQACYKEEVQIYQNEHPNINLDELWRNGERIIMPRALR